MSGVGNTVGTAAEKVGGTVGTAAEKVGDTVGTAAGKARIPALMGTAAAAGVLGGIALSSRTKARRPVTSRMPRPKLTRPHMPRPNMRSGSLRSIADEVQQVGKEIGKAGFRLGIGDVNMEVNSGGRKEKRDSPLEVLLHGLTSRRSRH